MFRLNTGFLVDRFFSSFEPFETISPLPSGLIGSFFRDSFCCFLPLLNGFLCICHDFLVENWTFESNNVVSSSQVLPLLLHLLFFVILILVGYFFAKV